MPLEVFSIFNFSQRSNAQTVFHPLNRSRMERQMVFTGSFRRYAQFRCLQSVKNEGVSVCRAKSQVATECRGELPGGRSGRVELFSFLRNFARLSAVGTRETLRKQPSCHRQCERKPGDPMGF
jgi:hypothetical protein